MGMMYLIARNTWGEKRAVKSKRPLTPPITAQNVRNRSKKRSMVKTRRLKLAPSVPCSTPSCEYLRNSRDCLIRGVYEIHTTTVDNQTEIQTEALKRIANAKVRLRLAVSNHSSSKKHYLLKNK
jgi:hypothetical protein